MDARKINTVPTLHPPPQLYHKETNGQMFCHTLVFAALIEHKGWNCTLLHRLPTTGFRPMTACHLETELFKGSEPVHASICI